MRMYCFRTYSDGEAVYDGHVNDVPQEDFYKISSFVWKARYDNYVAVQAESLADAIGILKTSYKRFVDTQRILNESVFRFLSRKAGFRDLKEAWLTFVNKELK